MSSWHVDMSCSALGKDWLVAVESNTSKQVVEGVVLYPYIYYIDTKIMIGTSPNPSLKKTKLFNMKTQKNEMFLLNRHRIEHLDLYRRSKWSVEKKQLRLVLVFEFVENDLKKCSRHQDSRMHHGGFKHVFFFFTPIWGRFPIWRAYFSDGWFNHQPV